MDNTTFAALVGFMSGALVIILFVAIPLVRANRKLQRKYGELDSKYTTAQMLSYDRAMNDEH